MSRRSVGVLIAAVAARPGADRRPLAPWPTRRSIGHRPICGVAAAVDARVERRETPGASGLGPSVHEVAKTDDAIDPLQWRALLRGQGAKNVDVAVDIGDDEGAIQTQPTSVNALVCAARILGRAPVSSSFSPNWTGLRPRAMLSQ